MLQVIVNNGTIYVLAASAKGVNLYCIDPESLIDDTITNLADMAYRVFELPTNVQKM